MIKNNPGDLSMQDPIRISSRPFDPNAPKSIETLPRYDFMGYQGPMPEGTTPRQEQSFRNTGYEPSLQRYEGPMPEGTTPEEEEIFRRDGIEPGAPGNNGGSGGQENRDYGGWYTNPDTGTVQRWWGPGIWTDGDEPGGSGNNGGSGGSSGDPDSSRRELEKQINSIFDDVNNYLGRAESNLRGDYPSILQDLQSQFGATQSQLATGRDQMGRMLDETGVTAEQRKLDAEAANARLVDELQRGSLQRFGGASSAGQAATELANVEAQRRQGQLQQSFEGSMRSIEQERLKLDENYNQQLQQLTVQKQMAENEARRNFQSKLLEIERMRTEAGQNKAQMKLQVLMDLRNQMNAISMQNTEFQQQLQMMREQANIQLQTQASQLAQTQGFTQNVIPNLAATTDVQPQSQVTPQPVTPTGQISQPRRRDDELFPSLLPSPQLYQDGVVGSRSFNTSPSIFR